MQSQFLVSALSAAKKSPELFAAEFDRKDADANVKQFGDVGDSLIHRLIKELPDADLPSILSILIEHHVDLDSRDVCGYKPLATAACYLKKDAVNFLLSHKVEVNDSKNPALYSVMLFCRGDRDVQRLDIVKSLVESGANINIQNEFSLFPLMKAVENRHLEVIDYLVSHGANLFLKYTYAGGEENKTALGQAYGEYIIAREIFNEGGEFTINAKKCLNFLMKAVSDYLYQQGKLFKGSDAELEIFLNKYIEDLACNFGHIAGGDKANSTTFRKVLIEKVLNPVLMRVKEEREQLHAFWMGSRLSAKQQGKNEPDTAIYRFFQKTNGLDLVPKIFAYVHEEIPNAIKDDAPRMR